MSRSARGLALIAMAAAGLLLGFVVRQALDGPEAPRGEHGLLGSAFPDLEGRRQALSQWRGKVVVVNFWATWCPPCRAEMPAFIRMQEKYRNRGVVFVGIALDRRDAVLDFVQSMGVNYPVLIGGIEGAQAARAAGNRSGGLPFTVVLDRQGRTAGMALGGMDETRLESELTPLL